MRNRDMLRVNKVATNEVGEIVKTLTGFAQLRCVPASIACFLST